MYELLRPYQKAATDAVMAKWDAGERHVLVAMPTGTGKTVLAAWIATAMHAYAKKPILFLNEAITLTHQAAAEFRDLGLKVAIEQGANRAKKSGADYQVVCATYQSLNGTRLLEWDKSAFGTIITDEAHHSGAAGYQEIYEYFTDYYHVGITATPHRLGVRDGASIYSSYAFTYSLRDALIGNSAKCAPREDPGGWIVPIIIKDVAIDVDLRKVGRSSATGDFNQTDLGVAIAQQIEPLAKATAEAMGNRKTVVFCASIRNAQIFTEILRKLGKSATWISGDTHTSRDERQRLLRAYSQDEYQYIVCAKLLREGWNEPSVDGIVIAKPTLLVDEYAQMIGRGTRLCPSREKKNCLVLDFSWQTTSSMDLVHAVELFAGIDATEEEIEAAKYVVAASKALGKEIQMEDAYEQAEEVIRRRNEIKIMISEAAAEYTLMERNHTLAVAATLQEAAVKHDPPASDRQRAFLRKLGARFEQCITSGEAQKQIRKFLMRQKFHMSTPGQIYALTKIGYTLKAAEAMSKKEASAAIDDAKFTR